MTPLSLILFLKDNKNKPRENTKTAGEEYYLEIMELTNKTTKRNAWKFGVRDRTGWQLFITRLLKQTKKNHGLHWLKLQSPASHPLTVNLMVTTAKGEEHPRDGRLSVSHGTRCLEGPSSSFAVKEERGHLMTAAWGPALESLCLCQQLGFSLMA